MNTQTFKTVGLNPYVDIDESEYFICLLMVVRGCVMFCQLHVRLTVCGPSLRDSQRQHSFCLLSQKTVFSSFQAETQYTFNSHSV
jgi:hypothetical protein